MVVAAATDDIESVHLVDIVGRAPGGAPPRAHEEGVMVEGC